MSICFYDLYDKAIPQPQDSVFTTNLIDDKARKRGSIPRKKNKQMNATKE